MHCFSNYNLCMQGRVCLVQQHRGTSSAVCSLTLHLQSSSNNPRLERYKKNKKKTDKIHTTERVFGSSNAPAFSGSLQTGDHQHMGMPRGHLCNGDKGPSQVAELQCLGAMPGCNAWVGSAATFKSLLKKRIQHSYFSEFV